MTSYIPVISEVLETQHDACLVDAEKLLKNNNLTGLVIVSKAKVYAYANCNWSFIIEDRNEQVVIIEHCAGYKCPDTIDIIEILGHELTLLPGQKLLFHTDGEIEKTVSYIKLN